MFGRLWGEPASAPTRDGGAQDAAADGGADDGAAAEREPAAESEPEPDDAGGDSGSEERDKDEEKRAGRQAWKRVQLKVAGQKTDKLTDGLLDGVSKTLKSAGGAAVSTAAEAKALAAANRDKVMQSAIDGAGVAGMKGLKALSDVVGATTGINVMADDRKEKDARSLFDELDADGSGFLDSGEVEELCKQMGRKLGKKELAKAMAEIDADGNDEVSFSEFEAWWALNRHETQVVYMEDGTKYEKRARTAKKERQRKQEPSQALEGAQTLEDLGVRVPSTASEQQVQLVNDLIRDVTNRYALNKGLQAGLLRYDVLVQHLGDPVGLEKSMMTKLESHRSGSQRTNGDLVSRAERGLLTGTVSTEDSGLVQTFGVAQQAQAPFTGPPAAANQGRDQQGARTADRSNRDRSSPSTSYSGRRRAEATTLTISPDASAVPVSVADRGGNIARRQRTASDPAAAAAAAFNRTGVSVPEANDLNANDGQGKGKRNPRPIRKPDTMEFRPKNRVKGREKHVAWDDGGGTTEPNDSQPGEIGPPARPASPQQPQPQLQTTASDEQSRDEANSAADTGMPVRTQSGEADIFASQLSNVKDILERTRAQQEDYKRRRQRLQDEVHTTVRELNDKQATLPQRMQTHTARHPHQPLLVLQERGNDLRNQFQTTASELHTILTATTQAKPDSSSPATVAGAQNLAGARVTDTETEKLIKEQASRAIAALRAGAEQQPQQPQLPPPVFGLNATETVIDHQQAWAIIQEVEERARKLPQYEYAIQAHARQGTARYMYNSGGAGFRRDYKPGAA